MILVGSAANADVRHSGVDAGIRSSADAYLRHAAADPAIRRSAAGTNVGVRQGRHGDLGRLVFDFPGVETIHTTRAGDLLTIQFTPALPMPSIAVNVPGIETLQGGSGSVQLQLAKGAMPHVYRIGNRVVVDATTGRSHGVAGDSIKRAQAVSKPAMAPPTAKPAPALALTAPAVVAVPATTVSSVPSVAAANPVAPSLVAAGPTANPVASTPATISPATISPAASSVAGNPIGGSLPAVAATPLAMPALPVNAGLPAPQVIDFATPPGAAAFRRGNDAIIVFDTAEIPDLTALQSSPAFANAALVSLQAAQIITLPLPPAQSLTLTPVADGWQVAAVPATPTDPTNPPPPPSGNKIEFLLQSADKAVTISDPLTGSDLLVGTVTQAQAQATPGQSGPGFAVLPAWLGVAIIPAADNLGLNVTPSGFELGSAARKGIPLGAAPAASGDIVSAAAFGPGLSLPSGDTAALRNRMLSDLHAAATLPPLGRLNAQTALAADMIALGLGPEARGVLDTAVLENPAAQDNSRIAGMRAVADVVAGKYKPADFAASGIVPSNELDFWKAAGQMQAGQKVQAAPNLAANLKVFEAYPAALRNQLNAEIGETLVDANQLQAAQQLTSSDPGNPILDLARAKLLEHQGQADAALAAYQKLSLSRDSRISAIAADRAVELRLAAGRINAGQAADQLDAALFDWRDPDHERHLRLRVAELRAKAGQWPQAFAMLQAARNRFPDHRSQIDATRSAMFAGMLTSNQFAQLSPIQAVAILQQNQDLIPAGAGSADVINQLAQRLDALDLPGAAAPMLSHLIQNIPPGVARATLGARLAQVDLDAGSPVASLADLAETQVDGLPPALVAQRSILNAKAQAAGGNAVAAVSNLGMPSASAAGPATANPAADAAPGAVTGSTDTSVGPASLAPPATDPATLETQAQIAEQSGQWPQAEQALGALVTQAVPAAGAMTADSENLLLRLATAASHNNDAAMLSSLASQYGKRVSADPAGQMFQTLTTPALTGDQGLNQALHEIAQLQALPAMLDAVSNAPATSAKAQTP